MSSRRHPAPVDVAFLRRCLSTLEHALAELGRSDPRRHRVRQSSARPASRSSRSSWSRAAKLLRKRLAPFFASNRQVDHLVFKDIFRHAAKHGLIEIGGLRVRWMEYRDNRNETAHDYGAAFARSHRIDATFPTSFPTPSISPCVIEGSGPPTVQYRDIFLPKHRAPARSRRCSRKPSRRFSTCRQRSTSVGLR